MVHGFTVLAIPPQSFLRRFRSDRSILIYDPSLGGGQGRVIAEEAAVQAVSGYELLFLRKQRLVNVGAKVFVSSVFLAFFIMAAAGPSFGLYLLKFAIAIMMGLIIYANFRLWRFRSGIWQSLERAIEVGRMSAEDKIRHGYRMTWAGRAFTIGWLLVLGPLYVFVHMGGHSNMHELLGIDPVSGRVFYKIFIVSLLLIGLCVIAFNGIKRSRDNRP